MTIRNGPPLPPAHLEVYVTTLGVKGAMQFLMSFGGAELYIPETAKPGSLLFEEMGREATEALIQVRDRIPAQIPVGKPWVAAVLFHQGLSKAQIARRLHATEATVRKWLNKQPPQSFQSDLFA